MPQHPSISTPIILLTGFLGSGKTTLLNAALDDERLADTAVLVNELGDVGIDHRIVARLERDVALLSSGCICCSVRDGIAETLTGLLERRSRRLLPAFRRIVVETTGLAHPAPIINTLLTEIDPASGLALGRVITTVDSHRGHLALAEFDESRSQITAADDLVLTKTDAADTQRIGAVREVVRRLNPTATIRESSMTNPAIEVLVDFAWSAKPAHLHAGLGSDQQHHDSRVHAVSLTCEGLVSLDRLVGWLSEVTESHGERLVRMKGLVRIRGHASPILVNVVLGALYPLAELNRPDEIEPQSTLIAIGTELDGAELVATFAVLAD